LAIVGIGCRFPGGVSGPEDYWSLIQNLGDGIVEVPKERWSLRRFYDPDPAVPGKVYVKSGGFLDQRIDQFDASFFGITPREAASMDPQQRLLLEVAWEAIEDSGQNPYELAGADVGVYVGAFTLDNNVKQMSSANRNLIGPHTAVGSTMTILSNRLSYVFDFRGPSLSIDTACSSSLVAFHFACQDLWRGACSAALAGGVNVMFAPEYTIAMCKGHFLSPDGRCKSFDDRANGYGRGEGAGIVVLKPLAAAIADRDRIYAMVRATGCNQDGRTSGITVPNPEAQASLLRRICSEAGVPPKQIVYVEAHGTGTPVGDPAEASALGAVVGAGRSNGDACAIGSVKANIGHLEAASGIAGLIKAALCVSRRTIPPIAAMGTPNRAIPFEKLGLRLPSAAEPMPEGDACVAINSFGYGGTNACALLSAPNEGGPAEPAAVSEADQGELPYFLPISARSEAALRQLTENYAGLLAEGGPALADVCYSAGARRGHHGARLAAWADSREGMVNQLLSFLKGQPADGHLFGTALVDGERPVFVFTGMGPQWWGMGQELYKSFSVFRETAHRCDGFFRALSGWSILEEMLRGEDSSRMRETQFAQPANFVIQAALTALLRSAGIEPAAIVGHSVGEVSSAYIAGALDIEDAVLVSYHRSRLQNRAAGLGSMLAAGMAAEEALEMLAGLPNVSLAAANSPSSVTLSGDTAALAAIAATLEQRGTFHRFLQVEVPYHSPSMDFLKDDLMTSLQGLRPQAPTIPVYSTVTGDRVDGVAFDAAYWWRNVREPVQFVGAMRKLIAAGHKVFLEVGPHPVLSASIKECLTEAKTSGVTIATLRRGEPERGSIARGIASLYACGAGLDWRKLYQQQLRFVSPPRYTWQRETYWQETAAALRDRVGEPQHPLLGDAVAGPRPEWQASLHRGLIPYLDDHRVEKLCILPGAAYVEVGLAVQNALGNSGACVLENLQFHQALVIDDGDERTLRSTWDEKTREYAIYSQSREGEGDWQLHATGRLSAAKPGPRDRVDLTALRQACDREENSEAHYHNMARRGLQYGKSFQGVRELYRNPARGEVLARIETNASLAQETHAYRVHPTLLDACFQALLAAVTTEDTYIPVRIAQMRFFGRAPGGFWCHGTQHEGSRGSIEGHLTLFDDKGEVFAEVRGVSARKLTDKQSNALESARDWLHRFEWTPEAFSDNRAAPGGWLIFIDNKETGSALPPMLAAQGAKSVIEVRRGTCFEEDGLDQFRISPDNDRDFDKLLERVGPERRQRIVYLWGLDAPLDPGDIVGSGDTATALRLVQALVRSGTSQPFHLFLVTRGAQPVGESSGIALAQAPLTGLVRVALNEYTEHRFTSVDLDSGAREDMADLGRELLAAAPEDEIALRSSGRYVHRLMRQPHALEDSGTDWKSERAPSSSPFRLEFEKPGVVTSARLRAMERKAPCAGEIEVRIQALALSQSALPSGGAGSGGEEDRPARPLVDVAGTVVRAGTAVEGFKPGDPVVARLADGGANYVTCPVKSTCVALRPRGMDQAASLGLLPFVFAIQALESAGLRRGERVLVHATGEAGLAAIQVARQMGGEVFAAASSAQDGDAVRALGAHHIVSGSPLDFPDELSALTGGAGLDVVFGLEEGEMLAKSFEALAAGGRYIHVREHDAEAPTLVPIPLTGNRSFAVLDSGTLLPSWPARFRELWERVCLESAALSPARRPLYPLSELGGALRAAGEGERPILTLDDATEIERLPLARSGELFHPEAWYLITGGFGGLGLEIAQWAVRQGARHLVLVGRRGGATPEARKAVAALEKDGATIWPAAVDITDRNQVDALFAELAEHPLPLRGVVHAAAVFDDAPLRDLDRRRLDTVLSPKALGAWRLHEGTLRHDLSFFVVFSSISAQVGSPGQASYVAANAYLDAFAHWRRAQGLPATSINWGAIGEVGILSRFDMVQEYLKRVGNRPLSPAQCSQMLGRVLAADPVQISVVDMDWQQWAQFHPAWAASMRFKHLIASEKGTQAPPRDEFLQTLLSTEDGARPGVVRQVVGQLVAKTMQLPAAAVDTERSLVSMGLDSLMAMELQVAIEKEMGVKLSTLELMKGTPIAQLSESLLKRLIDKSSEDSNGIAPHAVASGRNAQAATDTIERLEELSGEELNSLLISLSKETGHNLSLEG
jgi:acyl transferase domain-containing protein/NADPH:quinone reductase-like Zn-dependent oxidoreductase/acyl carrier protein